MTESGNTCPSSDELRAFLCETLSDAMFTRLASHIENCKACQHQLETLVDKVPDSLISPSDLQLAHARTIVHDHRELLDDDDALPSIEIPGVVVERLIGRGGMGMVFEARQTEPVHRAVAIKLIRVGLVHPEFDQRFQRERSLLASIEHPNVARLYDAGRLADGTPWFQMEFVSGCDIIDYCRRNRSGLQARVDLFLEVCGAVQHLHGRQIIHRDLKPDNILVTEVDGRPAAKLIDFGLAKLLDPEHAGKADDTIGNSPLGTPRYMSPEQTGFRDALTELDTTTDVYSLGIILYELMTGDTPIDRDTARNSDIVEILSRIRNLDPVRPSRRVTEHRQTSEQQAREMGLTVHQLAQHLDSDLDWIILKAIQRHRTERYTTVEALAQDLQNYSSNLPVSARPPSGRYLAQKFYQRNRTLVWSAALLLITLSAGLVGTAIGMFRAQDAEKLAHDAASREAAAHWKTEQLRIQEQAARLKSDQRLANLQKATGILQAIFEGFNPNLAGGGERELRDILLARLKKAGDDLLNVSVGEGDDVYTLKFALANSISALGEREAAIKLLEDILAEVESIDSIGLEDKLRLLATLAVTCMQHGDNDRAVELTTAANSQAAEAFPADHPLRLAMLNYHALAAGAVGQTGEAISGFEEILSAISADKASEATMYHNVLNNLAVQYRQAGRLDEAAEACRTSMTYFERQLPAEHPTLLTMRNNLATLLTDAGELEEAIKELRNILAINEQRFPPATPNVGEARIQLAITLAKANQPDEACTLLEEVVSITSDEQTRLRAELQLLGTKLLVIKATEVSIEDLQTLTKRIESALGENHLTTQTAYSMLQEANERATQSTADHSGDDSQPGK